MSCKKIKVWWSSLLEHCPMWGNKKNKKRCERSQNKKEAKEAQIKKGGQWSPPKFKKWEKKREGTMLLSFSTLVLQSSTMIFMIESLLCCHFHILVGIFHYRTWLVYYNDELPQIALDLHEQANWMHTHLVFFRAFIHL